MCRPNVLRGWCLISLGLGMIVGYSLESWIIACCGGAALMLLGLSVLGRRK